MVRNIWLGFVMVALFAFVYYKQVLHEERQLAGIFGESYSVYRRNVPRIVPRIIPYMKDKNGQFSFGTVLKNKEYNVALGITAIFLLMNLYEGIIYPFFVRHVF